MDPKVVTIIPDMIDLNDDLLSTLGKCETEMAAVSVIAFCQIIGNWSPFTKDQIERVFNQNYSHLKGNNSYKFEVCFEYLLEGDFVCQVGDHFMVTNKFVRRCYAKHPARSSFLA